MAEEKFDLGELVAACRDLAARSGELISTIYEKGDLKVVEKMYGSNKPLKSLADIKKVKDPQTIADEMAQKLIIGSLQEAFPLLTICGEEGDLNCNESDIVSDIETKFEMEVPDIYKEIDIKDLNVWDGMFL